MRTHHLYLHRLTPHADRLDAVVVIDVLRSFSTAAYAFAAGATVIHPVETASEGLRLQQRLPDAISVGAIAGGDPMPGFDHGNSPSAVAPLALAGRPLILSTAAGVRGLSRFRTAPTLFAGSLVCARATAQALLAAGAEEIGFIITGEWVDRDGDEDIACADYLDALVHGENPDPRGFAQRVRDSDFGRRFAAGNNPSLPRADLDLCAIADRFDFAMRATLIDGSLQLQPSTIKQTTRECHGAH